MSATTFARYRRPLLERVLLAVLPSVQRVAEDVAGCCEWWRWRLGAHVVDEIDDLQAVAERIFRAAYHDPKEDPAP